MSNNVPNGKLIHILTEKYFKRGSSRVEQAVFTSKRKLASYRDLFRRVLKLTKRPRMKYDKSTNKGILKVR